MEIDWSARAIFAACSLGLCGGILHLVRDGGLKEKYALPWLPLGAGLLFFGIFPNALVALSRAARLHYLTVVLLGVILAFTPILLYLTVRVSRQREDLKRLSQEMALWRARAGGREG